MTESMKSKMSTWVIFIISWVLGAIFGDGNTDGWADYIPFGLFVGGFLWLLLRLNGKLKFKK